MTDNFRQYKEVGTEPFKAGEGVLYEALKSAYKNRFATDRELIVNALDQYTHKDLKGTVKPVVIVRLDRLRNAIWIHDDATGIEDIRDFLRFGTVDATGYTGKKVGDEVSTRMNINEEIAGMKHLGKGSAVFASKTGTVEFWSNNNKRGYYLKTKWLSWVKYHEEAEPLPYVIMNISELPSFRQSKGLTVRISDVHPELLNFERVETEIVRWLKLRIARGARIYLEDVNNPEKNKRLEKPKDFDTTENPASPMLILKSGRRIRTCFKSTEKPPYLNVGVYVRQIWVKDIHMKYKVSGWFENPELELSPGREEIVEDDENGNYVDHLDKLEPYMLANYEPLGVDGADDTKRKEDRDLNKLVNSLQERFAAMFPTYSKNVVSMETQTIKDTTQLPANIQNAEGYKETIEREKEPFMKNVKYVNGGGEGSITQPCITKGPGRKGGKINPASVLTDPDGDNGIGDDPIHKVVVQAEEETGRDAYRLKTISQIETTVPAAPRIKVKPDAREDDERNVFVDDRDVEGRWIIVNMAKPLMRESWDSGPKNRWDQLAPFIVKAQVNFNCSDKEVDRTTYERMLDVMYEALLEIRHK
jgi:hypothetical protein